MGKLLRFIFCALVVSAKMLTVKAAVYSTPDTAQRFAQCLIEKMSESPFFTVQDRNEMIQVADVMSEAIKNMEYGRRGPLFVKLLLSAFITSTSHVVIVEDFAKSVLRKGVFETALEQCSVASTHYIDSDFIKESLVILSNVEESRGPKLDKDTVTEARGIETNPRQFDSQTAFDSRSSAARYLDPATNPQGSFQFNPRFPSAVINPQSPRAFQPYAVNPSSVQNPFMPTGSDPNIKTVFEIPDSQFDFSPHIPLSQSETNSRFPSVPNSNAGRPSFPPGSGILHANGDYSPVRSDVQIPQSYEGYFPRDGVIAPSFGFENFRPQTGENSRGRNEPMTSNTGMNFPFQERPVPPTGLVFQNPQQTVVREDLSSRKDASKTKSDSELLKENVGKNSANFTGLNVPQEKESNVRLISPLFIAENIEKSPPQGQAFPENSGVLYQTSSAENVPPQKISSFPMTSSAMLPQADRQTSDIPVDQALENIILNILTNSTTFRNAFNFGNDQTKAVDLARKMTEQSLKGYDSNILGEILNAVSNAVASVKYGSPDNYALALSSALTSVLKMRNLPLFVDGSKIATNMLSILSAIENVGNQKEEISNPDDNVQVEIKQSPSNSKTPENEPENTYQKIFCDALKQFILKADGLSGFFCSNEVLANPLPIYFGMIKFTLFEYGDQVSSVGASVASTKLSGLSGETLCSDFSQIIAEAVTRALDEYGFLAKARPDNIATQMAINLKKLLSANTQIRQSGTVLEDEPQKGTANVQSEAFPRLQPSFPGDSFQTDLAAGGLPPNYENPPPLFNPSSVDSSQKTAGEPPSEQFKVMPDPPVSSDSSSQMQISPSEKQQELNDTQSNFPNVFHVDLTDDEFTTATTCFDSVLALTESPETEQSTDHAADGALPEISDDGIDQTELSSHLLGEIESTLDAFQDTYGNPVTASFLPQHDVLSTESRTNQEKNNPPENPYDSQSKEPIISDDYPQDGSVQNEKSSSRLDPNAARSFPQTGESSETDNLRTSDSLVKTRNSRRQPPGIFYSTDYDTQGSPVALQPSFRGPPNYDSSFESSETLPEGGTQLHGMDYEEASLIFAKAVSQLAAESIAFVESENFNLWALCGRLNELAPILKIPPLDFCGEIAVIDYLLHVLRSVIRIVKGV